MATDTERGADGQTPWQRLSALPLSKLAFVTSLWRNVPVGTLLLGNTPLDQIPTPVGADGNAVRQLARRDRRQRRPARRRRHVDQHRVRRRDRRRVRHTEHRLDRRQRHGHVRLDRNCRLDRDDRLDRDLRARPALHAARDDSAYERHCHRRHHHLHRQLHAARPARRSTTPQAAGAIRPSVTLAGLYAHLQLAREPDAGDDRPADPGDARPRRLPVGAAEHPGPPGRRGHRPERRTTTSTST